MSDPFSWVAPSALGLSVISLGWQVVTYARRRPRIKVGLEREPHYAEFNADGDIRSPDRCSMHITVQNPGAEDLWVNDAGVLSDGIVLGLRGRRTPMRMKIGPGGLSDLRPYGAASQASLPGVIPARGHVQFSVSDQLTKPHGDAREWMGFAELYRAGKKPRRILSKESAARLQ